MFKLIIFLILHTSSLCVHADYYNVRYPQSKKNILGNVLTNSGINLKTLKQLAKNFPNHAIEIQIQRMKGEPVPKPKYRMNQPWLRENQQSHQNSPHQIETVAPSSTTQTTAPTTTMTTTRTLATTTVASSQITTDLFNLQIADHQKRPLYMEDLIQALEDFEKKLGNKTKNGNTSIRRSTEDGNRSLVKKDLWELQKSLTPQNCNSNQESGSNEERTPAKAYHKHTPIRNFYDVVKLMQKGVKVQLEATTPADTSNFLNWVPIKIQKEI